MKIVLFFPLTCLDCLVAQREAAVGVGLPGKTMTFTNEICIIFPLDLPGLPGCPARGGSRGWTARENPTQAAPWPPVASPCAAREGSGRGQEMRLICSWFRARVQQCAMPAHACHLRHTATLPCVGQEEEEQQQHHHHHHHDNHHHYRYQQQS